MPKQYNIKWRASDNEKLKKRVTNFNRKIDRQLAKGISSDMLPQKISISDLRGSVKTRKDFNKTVNRLERFSRKDATKTVTTKQGLTVPKWQRDEMAIALRSINASRTMQRNKINATAATSRGVPLGTTRGQMGDIRQSELSPVRISSNAIKSSEEWQKAIKAIEFALSGGAQNAERYKQNYLKALHGAFGNSNDPELDAMYQKLVEHIENMSAQQVVETYYRDEEASIKFIGSNNLGDESADFLEVLYNTWGMDWESELATVQNALEDIDDDY